jgi:hypothetical protein
VFGDRFIGTSLEVGGLVISGNTVTSLATNSNIVLDPQGSARVQVNGPLTVTGTMQVSSSQTVDMGSNRIQSVATPTSATDAATKGYADGLASNYATAAQGATADSAMQNFTISGDDSAAQTVNNGYAVDFNGEGLVTTSVTANKVAISVATQTLETVTNAGATTINGITVGSVDTDGIRIVDNNITSTRSNDDIILDPAGTGTVDINANRFRVSNSKTPASSVGAAGDQQGDIAWDASYIYVCTANYDSSSNIWKRVAIGETW